LAYNTNGLTTSNNNVRYDVGTAVTDYLHGVTFGTWPATFGTPSGQFTGTYSIYGSAAPWANTNYFVDIVFNQNHGVTLGWTASVVDGTHGAPTNYEVQKAPLSGTCGSFSTIGTPTATALTDTAVTSQAQYCYQVRATNSGGPSAYTTPVQVTMGTF
jgi:hypothetical protein